MSKLNYRYIAELVRQAQAGDSNAFAELFAATHQKQYAFARNFLGDEQQARRALQDAYVYALKNLFQLRETALVVVWLNQAVLRACLRIERVERQYARAQDGAEDGREISEARILQTSAGQHSVRQIMTLPCSESQTILLRLLCGMRTGQIAALLEIDRGDVRRYARGGLRRLSTLSVHEEVARA